MLRGDHIQFVTILLTYPHVELMTIPQQCITVYHNSQKVRNLKLENFVKLQYYWHTCKLLGFDLKHRIASYEKM